jgi:hypothetical protein
MSGSVSGAGGSGDLAGVQSEALANFEKESIESTEFQMQMQTLQTQSSDAHKAAGASTTS